jgi:hypothetical protein
LSKMVGLAASNDSEISGPATRHETVVLFPNSECPHVLVQRVF